MHARPFEASAREITETDRLTALWPHSTGMINSLGRAAVGVLTAVFQGYVRLRAHSSSLWVSDRWLAEYERQSSKHKESI